MKPNQNQLQILQQFLLQYQTLEMLLAPINVVQDSPRRTKGKMGSPIDELKHFDERTELFEDKIEEEEISQIADILSELRNGGKLVGKQSLAFAYDVGDLKLRDEQKRKKMKQFFLGRARRKRKYEIPTPQNIGILNPKPKPELQNQQSPCK